MCVYLGLCSAGAVSCVSTSAGASTTVTSTGSTVSLGAVTGAGPLQTSATQTTTIASFPATLTNYQHSIGPLSISGTVSLATGAGFVVTSGGTLNPSAALTITTTSYVVVCSCGSSFG